MLTSVRAMLTGIAAGTWNRVARHSLFDRSDLSERPGFSTGPLLFSGYSEGRAHEARRAWIDRRTQRRRQRVRAGREAAEVDRLGNGADGAALQLRDPAS